MQRAAVLLAVALQISGGINALSNFTFPDGFLFGVSTSAYQVEGAWNESGKGPSIWDTFTHNNPALIANRSNADVACDTYHKYKEDVQLLKNLGVNFYRFSISWSRIFPQGYAGRVNQAGVHYYNSLIDELLANNIQPMVTMYHWDLPQPLQDIGGWPNVLLAQHFEDYARALFENFGDRVKWWATFNEPQIFVVGYSSKKSPPQVFQPGLADYLAARTVILSHARVYHMYYREFKKSQQGKVGIVLNINWCQPNTSSIADADACERFQQFLLGLYAHPIFTAEGDYPDVMKERIANFSTVEGYQHSRLPGLTCEEISYIRGTSDYFGLNYYTTFISKNGETGYDPSFQRDSGNIYFSDPSLPPSASPWLTVEPKGFRKELQWLAKEYNNPPIIVTENGYSDHGELNDTWRIKYVTSYMSEMLKAMHIDGCNVIGYSYWSFLDNFEWKAGYTQKFGMYQVDFNEPSRPRTAKASVDVYKEIIRTRRIPDKYKRMISN